MSDNSDNELNTYDPEQEAKFNWTPKINLPELLVQTGEEDEDILFKSKAKIYRWKEEEWKERGSGKLKILRSRITKKIRVLMRQDRTLRIIANFLIQDDPLCNLKYHLSSDKSFFVLAHDFSDEKIILEKFVIKFSCREIALKFEQSVKDAKVFTTALKLGHEPIYAAVFDDNPEELITLELRKDSRSLSFNGSLDKFSEEKKV